MEDFGFKLQNIKNKYNFKKIAKILLIVLSVIFSLLILIKIIKLFSSDSNENIESVVLIKSNVKNIKKLPDKEGGLVVDNLNISVYDVIDNNKDTEVNPIIKKTKQNIDLNQNNNDIILEQELLAEKINEISQNETILENVNQEENINQEENKIQKENINKEEVAVKAIDIDNNLEDIKDNNNLINASNNSINNNIVNNNEVNANIKIISTEEKENKTNINELKKLGNEALIKNLKEKKDIKPGIRVQLLALKTKDKLVEYWKKLNKDYNKLFFDKNYYIEKVNVNGTDLIYRLQVGNFLDEESAKNFCKEYIKITNRNKLDCIIIDIN